MKEIWSRKKFSASLAFLLAVAIVCSDLPVNVYAMETGEQDVTVSSENAKANISGESVSDDSVSDDSVSSGFADNILEVSCTEEQTYIPEEGLLADNEELAEGYIETMLGISDDAATVGTYGENVLTGLNKTIYTLLKEKVAVVAAATSSTSTAFTFTVEDLGLPTTSTSYTASDLGVSSLGTVTDQAVTFADGVEEALSAKIDEDGSYTYQLEKVLNLLCINCPYDLYWYDKVSPTKVSSVGYGYSFTYDDSGAISSIIVESMPMTFSFPVASAYQGDEEYTVSGATSATVQTAVEKAESIVEKYASESDYNKLLGYREEICSLVSYNDEAASSDYTGGYGDPWQLIYVFDGEDGTEVVCEGYAKAFQYLCDLTSFTSDNVICYTVTGTMSGGTGEGAHMWNIVTMDDGENYLVDVTNCDEGTVGADTQLFLAGTAGGITSGYKFTVTSGTVSYNYDSDTTDIYGTDDDSILNLASSDYTPKIAATVTTKPTALDLTYDTTAQALVSAGIAENGTMVYCLTEDGDYTTTISSATDAGTYIVYYKAQGNGENYTDSATGEVSVTIKKADPTATAPSVTATYGQTLKDLTLENPSGNTAGTWAWTDSSQSVGDVGTKTFTATFKPSNATNYNSKENVKISVTVSAKSLESDDISTSSIANQNYTGAALEPAVTVTDGSTTLTAGTDYAVAYSANTNVGTASVTITGKGNYTGEKTVTFSIVKTAASVTTAPTANTLTYTSSVQNLVTAGSASGGTMVYSLTENGTYAKTIPTGTGAGNYTVYYYAKGDSNHSNSEVGSVAVTISKATPDVTAPTAETTYGQTLAAVTLTNPGTNLSGTWVWTDSSQSVGDAGTKTFTATFTPKDETNYNSVENVNVTVTVIAKSLTSGNIKVASIAAQTYTGAAIEPAVTVTDGSTTLTSGTDYTVAYSANTNVGTASVTITGKDNYTGEKTETFSIVKAAASVTTAPTANDLTYTGSAQKLVTAGKASGGTMVYSLTKDGTYAEDIPAGTDAVEYIVYYYAQGDSNYSNSEVGSVSVTIQKADPTVTAPSVTATYGQTLKDLTLENPSENTAGTWAWTDDSQSVGKAGTNTFTANFTPDESKNYNSVENVKVTVTVDEKSFTSADIAIGSIDAQTYTGVAIEPDVIVTDGSTTLTAGTDYTVAYSANTNVGTASVTITGKGNYTGEKTETFSIVKAAASVTTAPTANTLTYTGSVQNLVTAGSASGGTMVYSLTENGTYAKAIPTGTNADNYTVYYYVQGDSNHSDSKVGSVGVTISKATPDLGTVSVASPATIYMSNKDNITLTREDKTVPGVLILDVNQTFAVGTAEYSYTFTPVDTDNYNTVTGKLKITVIPKTLTGIDIGTTKPAKTAYTYGDEFDTTGLTVTATYDDGTTADVTNSVTVGALSVGQTEIILSYTEDSKTETCKVSGITVEKATLAADGETVLTVTYGKKLSEISLSLTAKLGSNEVKGTWAWVYDTTYTAETILDADTAAYAVTAKFTPDSGADNYKELTQTISLTISKADPVVTAPTANTLSYSGTVQTLVKEGSTTGGSLLYSLDGKNYTTNVPTAAEVGDYTVYYKVDGQNNYNDVAPETVKVSIQKATPMISTVSVTAPETIYPGTTGIVLTGKALGVDGSNVEGVFTLAAGQTLTVDNQEYKYTFTPADSYSGNYAAVNGTVNITVTANTLVSISSGDTQPDKVDYTYGETFETAGLTVTATYRDGSEKNVTDEVTYDALAAGQTEITLTYTDDGVAASCTIFGITVSKAIPVVTAPAANELTYNGSAQQLVKAGSTTGGILYYSFDGETYTQKVPTAVDAGDYTVYYKVLGGTNYNDVAPQSVKVTIGQTASVETDTASRIIVKEGISEIPQELKAVGFDTEEKITAALMERVVIESSGYCEEHTVTYDVDLQYSLDGGKTWITATEENFPESGLTVTLSYPDGTSKDGYEFAVAHMFAHAMYGHNPGEIETPTVTNTDEGIQFTVYGLSPITVAWKEVAQQSSETETESNDSVQKTETESSDNSQKSETTAAAEVSGAPTGDTNVLWMWFAVLFVIAGAMGVLVWYRKAKR